MSNRALIWGVSLSVLLWTAIWAAISHAWGFDRKTWATLAELELSSERGAVICRQTFTTEGAIYRVVWLKMNNGTWVAVTDAHPHLAWVWGHFCEGKTDARY